MQAARGASTQTTAPNPFVAVVLPFPSTARATSLFRRRGDLCVRAPAAACSLSVLAALAGIAFVAWTVVVAHNGNTRGIQLTAIVTAATAPALILTVAFAYARRSGWGFAMMASRPTLAQDPGRPSSGRGDAERVLPGRIDPVTARTGDADA